VTSELERVIRLAIGYAPVPLSIREHPEITAEYRTSADADGLVERISEALVRHGVKPDLVSNSPIRLGEPSNLIMPLIGAWTAMNDVEERDGYMYWAVFEYVLEEGNYARQLTQYDLSGDEAWAVANSHNAGMGFIV